MGTTSSITMQKFGEIELRAPAVGLDAKIWCLYVFCLFVCYSCVSAGALLVRG